MVEKLGIREIGYAPRFLHIDGAWRDHRLFAITGEECPEGLLAPAPRARPDGPCRTTPVTPVIPRHTGRGARRACVRAPTLGRVDLSALIFVALAVAWAVYLIPKALEHHEEVARSRTVDAFSHSVRVLARREPVSRREATLVAGDDPAPPSHRELRREARLLAKDAKREAKRQRRNARRLAAAAAPARSTRGYDARPPPGPPGVGCRVVTLILAEIAIVAVLAAVGVFGWVWMAIPVGILVAWLVACRLMVRRERAELPGDRDERHAPTEPPSRAEARRRRDPGHRRSSPRPPPAPTRTAGTRSRSRCRRTSPSRVATRSVRTIDLDSTGRLDLRPQRGRQSPWSATRRPLARPSPAPTASSGRSAPDGSIRIARSRC